MNLPLPPNVLPHLLIALLYLFITAYSWIRRRHPGARVFALNAIFTALWAFATAFAILTPDPLRAEVWKHTAIIGVTFLPVFWFVFALEYTARSKSVSFRTWFLLTLLPIVNLIVVCIQFIFSTFQIQLPSSVITFFDPNFIQYKVIDVAFVFYSFVLLIIGALIMLQGCMRTFRIYRGQYYSLLLAALAPWTIKLILIFIPSASQKFDLLILSYFISAIAIFWCIYRCQLFDVQPVTLDTVMDHIHDGVIFLDLSDKVVNLNLAAQTIVNLKPQQAIGKGVTELLPELDQAMLSRTQNEFVTEISKRQTHLQRIFEARVSPVFIGQDTFGRLVSLTDITVRKAAECTLTQAVEAAEHANRNRFTLLVKINHALRTPLNTIIGFTEMLQEDAQYLNISGLLPDLKKIRSAGKHLYDLLNDLRDISLIEAGKINPSSEDFENTVKDNDLSFPAIVSPSIPEKESPQPLVVLNHTRELLDLLDRSHNGKSLPKQDWDYDYVTLGTRKLVEKYQLTWNKNEIIPQDPSLVERIFQAGLELAQQTGVYCASTGRIIEFTGAELEAGLHNMPGSLLMGEGADVRTLYARHITDERPPLVWAGNPGAPTPEHLFLPMVMSWMQEPLVDLVTCGSLTKVDEHEVRTGEPSEIIATRRELQWMRQGLRQVGRPGMGMLAAQSSVSELGDLAVSNPTYLRPCDAHLVPMFNELIIDHHNMARAINSLDYGVRNASLSCVMVGGLGGDAPGAAVVQTASFILANLVCRAHYHLLHPIHIRHIATTTRAVMWVQSAVSQAFALNAPCIIVADIYPKSGALTRELLYEVAANTIVATVSGAHLEGVGSADDAAPHSTGLEARLMAEMGQTVTKQRMDLNTASQLVSQLLERYEHVFKLPGGNPGVPFDLAYDLTILKPLPSWMAMYNEVKADLQRMGLLIS